MKQDKTSNIAIVLVSFFLFLAVFPLIWFGGGYLLSQGDSPFLNLSKSEKDLFVCIGGMLWVYFIFTSYPSLEESDTSERYGNDDDEIPETFSVLLETKIIRGRIFTFSADLPKLPLVGEVLVIYSDDEDDYVEFTVEQVSMAIDLLNGEDYLVKGQVCVLGQDKLGEYGWEEK